MDIDNLPVERGSGCIRGAVAPALIAGALYRPGAKRVESALQGKFLE